MLLPDPNCRGEVARILLEEEIGVDVQEYAPLDNAAEYPADGMLGCCSHTAPMALSGCPTSDANPEGENWASGASPEDVQACVGSNASDLRDPVAHVAFETWDHFKRPNYIEGLQQGGMGHWLPDREGFKELLVTDRTPERTSLTE